MTTVFERTDAAPVLPGFAISQHGMERTMERLHVNEARAKARIARAWEQGFTKGTAPLSWQRKYLKKITRQLEDGETNVRLYQDYIYIFSAGGVLITMYRPPKQRCGVLYAGKTQVRNLRKYQRMYRVPDFCPEQ